MSNKVMVETSARHLHVSPADLETLFGKGATLTNKKELSQPGQYACAERVTVVGPKREIAGVTILGPTRNDTQVELSATDARSIGLNVPIRESGDIKGSAGCKLIGPAGEVTLTEGVIVAKRHIHASPDEAARIGVSDKEVVCVKVTSDQRTLTFDDVVVRVRGDFNLTMHIDTDEANAAQCAGEMFGEVIKK